MPGASSELDLDKSVRGPFEGGGVSRLLLEDLWYPLRLGPKVMPDRESNSLQADPAEATITYLLRVKRAVSTAVRGVG